MVTNTMMFSWCISIKVLPDSLQYSYLTSYHLLQVLHVKNTQRRGLAWRKMNQSLHTLTQPMTESWSWPRKYVWAPKADKMITLTWSPQTEQSPGETSWARSVLCSHAQDRIVSQRVMPRPRMRERNEGSGGFRISKPLPLKCKQLGEYWISTESSIREENTLIFFVFYTGKQNQRCDVIQFESMNPSVDRGRYDQ